MGRICGQLCRFWVIGLIVLAAVAGSGSAAERASVNGVRVADHDGITRFVVDLSTSVPFQVYNQGEQARVVVELPELDWTNETKGSGRGVGLLRSYHYEQPSVGNGRLVLDAAHPVQVQKSFIIPPAAASGYRLVIDLVAGSASQASGNPILTPAGASMRHAPPPAPSRAKNQAMAVPAKTQAIEVPAKTQAMAVPGDSPAGKSGERKGARGGKPTVVIDPGHGGVDPGATSLSGVYEKNIVLALARDVKTQLDKDGKVKCILTRDRDVFIPLRERVAIGRAAGADLFISLHADTVADPDIRGLSVYTLSQTSSDSEAQALADKENKADIVAGIDLSNESPEVTNILIDLVQRESMNLSAVFAHRLIQEVSHETRQLLQNTHRFAGFAVLKAPDVPSVLVETGYLSNSQDEQMLRRPEYRAKLAAAMAQAVERYFAQTKKARRS